MNIRERLTESLRIRRLTKAKARDTLEILTTNVGKTVAVIGLRSGLLFVGRLEKVNPFSFQARLRVNGKLQILNMPLRIVEIVNENPLTVKLNNGV